MTPEKKTLSNSRKKEEAIYKRFVGERDQYKIRREYLNIIRSYRRKTMYSKSHFCNLCNKWFTTSEGPAYLTHMVEHFKNCKDPVYNMSDMQKSLTTIAKDLQQDSTTSMNIDDNESCVNDSRQQLQQINTESESDDDNDGNNNYQLSAHDN